MADGVLSTNEAQQAADDVVDTVTSREGGSVGIILGGGALGAIAAQEVAERVLVGLNMPRQAETGRQLGVSLLTKIIFALVSAAIAVQFSGLGLAIGAFWAVGALISAGVDFFQMLQRGGLPGQDVADGSNRQRNPAGGPDTGNGRQPDSGQGGASSSWA